MTSFPLLKGKRILVVDDEPDVLDTLVDLLADCEVTTAGSFEDAKRFLESQRFDIVILDIMGVSGYELLHTAVQKNLTAVMLTAHALSPENVSKSFKEGAAYFIPKEEMVNIATFLHDILDAQQKGRSTWGKWFERLGTYCERHFGPNWKKDDQVFWEKFPFH